MRRVIVQPLSRAAFARFGAVIDADGAERSYPINAGRCIRHHAIAAVDTDGAGTTPIISLFRSEPVAVPFDLTLMERHPMGSQAFMPLDGRPFLVVVADDEAGRPAEPIAFLTAPGQGVSIARNVWHGPLMPLERTSDFLVVDRSEPAANLEEWTYAEPWRIAMR